MSHYGFTSFSLTSLFNTSVKYSPEKASIDGSCLCELEEKDLEEELKIGSKIIRKKLMKWVTKGIAEYSEYLNREGTVVIPKDFPFKHKLDQMEGEEYDKPAPKQEPVRMLTTHFNRQPILEEEHHELIISNLDSSSSMFYSINEEGAKIGRQSSNQIVIPDEGISRLHAEIGFHDSQFFLRDIGSTTGTFIKINGRFALEIGNIIQMGANQFEISHLECESKDSGRLELQVIESSISEMQGQDHYVFQLGKGDFKTIGRKTTNHISFSTDQHLSSLHAKIYILDGKFYIEDQCSTNGTWRRLSTQGMESEPVLLDNGSVFKIGITMSYVCKTKKQMQVVQQVVSSCIICCDEENDCLYMPCKHNVCCFKCSKSLQKCPICKNEIADIVKMYKS